MLALRIRALGRTKDNTVLLTLGRLPAGLDIARSFHAAGWRVIVADPWRLNLLRSSNSVARSYRVTAPAESADRYLDELLRIVDRESVSLVVPVSEETAWVAGLPSSCPVFAPSRSAYLGLHDKWSFVRKAQGLGLSVPDSARAEDDNTTLRQAPFVTKPRFSCSGRGVRFYAAGATIAAEPGLLVQRRIDGQPVCEFCIADEGRILAGSRYLPRLVDGSVAVAFERTTAYSACGDWARQFVAAEGHTGFIAFDFIVDADGTPYALECNPRATSGIHFLDRDAISTAIVERREPAAPFRDSRLMAEHYSCLTLLLAKLGDAGRRREIRALMRTAKDICYAGDDPWPFLAMMVNSWGLVRRALFGRHSFASAAVADVEWQSNA